MMQHSFQRAHWFWRPIYAEDTEILDTLNCKYFLWYCDFSNRALIYQACKHLCDKLRQYKQGINIDEECPALNNNQDEEHDEKNMVQKTSHQLCNKFPALVLGPVASSVKEALSHDLQALAVTMQAYCLEVMSWLCSTTFWKLDRSRKLVFNFLGYPSALKSIFWCCFAWYGWSTPSSSPTSSSWLMGPAEVIFIQEHNHLCWRCAPKSIVIKTSALSESWLRRPVLGLSLGRSRLQSSP